MSTPTTLIRCTQKLRKEMGLGPSTLVESSSESLLGDWYTHLFFESRKKCVLFVSEKTLLSFLCANVRRDQLRNLDDLFREGLFRLLLEEGFHAEQATPLFDQCRSILYGPTADRSMTGTMNELVKEAQFWLPRHGGVATSDLATLHHRLNRNPLKRNGYENAIERAQRALGVQLTS